MSKSYYENIRNQNQAQLLSDHKIIQNQINNETKRENKYYSIKDRNLNNTITNNENSSSEVNQKLIAQVAFLETMSKKKDQKIIMLMEEISHLKGATESFEELKMRINIYERIDFPSILRNSGKELEIKNEIICKIRNIEADFGKEIIQLNRKVEELKLQIYNLNISLENNNNTEAFNNNNDFITKKDSEIMELKIKLAKAEISIDIKANQIKRHEDELEQQRSQINKLMIDNNILNSGNLTPQFSTNSMENTLLNPNSHSDCVKEIIHRELNAKFAEVQKISETLQEELDSEKNKYLALLEMNQDLGKKVIENIKIINDNKSEILYLKKKVAEMQKEKGDTTVINDSVNNSVSNESYINNYKNNSNNNNSDFNLIKEEFKKAREMRQHLEKISTEHKLQVLELTEQLKLLKQKTQTITEELKLEKLENENLKEIQKSDLKNISKILSENSSQQQLKKTEELMHVLKSSLQNTNKINIELANQKSLLEKEVFELRSRFREQQTSFMLISSDKELHQNSMLMKDDKSLAAFSKYSIASNMTSSKFFDSKIKDLEESLVQEKENAENLLLVKQRIIAKLKKSNENLLLDKNKLMRELAEEKMKNNSLAMEKQTLLASEEYFKVQIQELNAEICDLRLYQENYELIEEKLEEFQKQFANLVNVYDNPYLQSEQYQKLVNENVHLNAYKSKYFQIECEMQEKNKDILMLKDKVFSMEREASARNNSLNCAKVQPLQQVSNDININNINFNSINNDNYNSNNSNYKSNNINNSNNQKCGNCALLESNMGKYKQILDEYNNKISENQHEINELKNIIEDNKLVIFSLREKCKEMISKEKEILRLNTIITELNNRKKKKVSFGKEIIVEYEKDNSPSEPVNERQVSESVVRRKEDNNAAFKLSDLLRSQEHLFEKYQKEFEGLKKYRTPVLSVDSNEITAAASEANLDSNDSEKNRNNTNSNVNNYIQNNYNNYNSEGATGSFYSNNNNYYYPEQNNNAYANQSNSSATESNYQTNDTQINFENSRKQEATAKEEQTENSESIIGSGKINIEAYKNLSTNLEFEFERIKNKYNLAEGENNDLSYADRRSLENTGSLGKNSNSIFKSFCERLDIASMSKSQIFSADMLNINNNN